MKMYYELSELYNPKSKKSVHYLKREANDSFTLTPMCLEDAYLSTRIQSKRTSKLFYSLEWRCSRRECEGEKESCIYNLIWYEPFVAFICMQGNRPRVFVCYSPLLDKDGRPTSLEFLYGAYTMCTSPKFVCFVRNIVNNKIELWSDDGNYSMALLSKCLF